MKAVSRETRERLSRFVQILKKWQSSTNLISPATLDEIWTRHIEDSLQLADLAEGSDWVDLGSGGGLPGLVIAIARADTHMTLIESDSRKCAFLRVASHEIGIAATVVQGRIESILPGLAPPPAIISARALAPLEKLLDYGQSALSKGAIGLFPKGKAYAEELTAARKSWHFEADLIPSETDPSARIIRVRDFRGPV